MSLLAETTLLVVASRDRGACRGCGILVGGERGRDWSIHHRLPRGMGGTKTRSAMDPRFLLLLCGSGTTGCHGRVERNRAESYRRGFLLRHTQPPTDPDAVPVIPWAEEID